MTDELKPCPFCNGGETRVDEKTLPPTMKGPGALIGVTVRHWCEGLDKGAQRLTVEAHGRDRADAIAAWNARAPAVPEGYALVPVVPTQEMLKSADDALMFTYRASDWDEAKDVIEGLSLKEIYDKFIAAAPKVTP